MHSVTLTKKTVNKGKKIDISYLPIIIYFKIVLRSKRRAVMLTRITHFIENHFVENLNNGQK
jgi:hypothetical protein